MAKELNKEKYKWNDDENNVNTYTKGDVFTFFVK